MLKKIVIVAGEESGDIHVANFVEKLLAKNSTLSISGIGGKHMEAAGVSLIYNLAQYGVTGLSEVLRQARVIKAAFKLIKMHLAEEKPDLLILVDYPGFNLRLAKFAKEKLGLKILYYISPQIWAWKANRIHRIRAYVDYMAVILPFEKNIYEKANVPVSFVGHPLVEKIPAEWDVNHLRQQLNLPKNKKIVALLPGSRHNEIKRHLPVMRQSAEHLRKELPDIHYVIPIAKTLAIDDIKPYFSGCDLAISYINGQALEVAALSDCVVVASGTASLECALLLKPMCIIYKSSLITYIAAMKLIKVAYLGLCNLLENTMLVPELLQYDCNAKELAKTMYTLLTDDIFISKMQQNLAVMKQNLSLKRADCSIEDLILAIIENN